MTLVDVHAGVLLELESDSAVAGEAVFFFWLCMTRTLCRASVDSVLTWVDTLTNIARILYDELLIIFLLNTDALAVIFGAAWPVLCGDL